MVIADHIERNEVNMELWVCVSLRCLYTGVYILYTELSSVRSRNESSSNEISQLEMMLREHRDRETDQTEALKAKDSQV